MLGVHESTLMTELYFQLRYTVKDLHLPEGTSQLFTYNGPHRLEVVLTFPSPADQDRGHKRSDALCTASSRLTPSEKALLVFDQIETNAFGSVPRASGTIQYQSQSGSPISIPALSGFPEHFQSFMSGTHDELSDIATRTVLVLRWRCN